VVWGPGGRSPRLPDSRVWCVLRTWRLSDQVRPGSEFGSPSPRPSPPGRGGASFSAGHKGGRVPNRRQISGFDIWLKRKTALRQGPAGH
jgi:hypothetical protein